MIKSIKILFIVVIISGCARQKPEQQLEHLQGYWEIKRVEINPDSVREYKFNETVDYIEIKTGAKGTRTKVRPQLDGSYQVTGVTENIEAVMEEDELFLKYTTPYDTWRERVIHAEENDLKLQNDEGVIYHYQRYIPTNIKKDEKE